MRHSGSIKETLSSHLLTSTTRWRTQDGSAFADKVQINSRHRHCRLVSITVSPPSAEIPKTRHCRLVYIPVSPSSAAVLFRHCRLVPITVSPPSADIPATTNISSDGTPPLQACARHSQSTKCRRSRRHKNSIASPQRVHPNRCYGRSLMVLTACL